jgi:hypothetical protein
MFLCAGMEMIRQAENFTKICWKTQGLSTLSRAMMKKVQK